MTDTSYRKPPRWTEPFLLAFIRTGEVRETAKWAGVDFTTAYARRKAHSDFADAWDDALALRKTMVAEAEAAELQRIEADAVPPLPNPSPAEGRGAIDAQVKRVNSARWSEARERRFFDELVASANVRRAAEAAGVSSQAVYARRAKSAVFRRRWDQALANGRAAIEMGLVAEAKRSLDPDEMDLPAPDPRVTVGEAIKITQMSQAAGARGHGRGPGGAAAFEEDEAEAHEQAMEELRARLQWKIEGLRARMVREDGRFEDEQGHLVPPGYIRDPNHVAKPRG